MRMKRAKRRHILTKWLIQDLSLLSFTRISLWPELSSASQLNNQRWNELSARPSAHMAPKSTFSLPYMLTSYEGIFPSFSLIFTP
ncbi:hypothetical protein F5B21DRAFT_488751 [Xylaria acuta]|nr:hypothetical protein F5B21DRAFT_488751 [Xylaria acuta]